MKKLFLTLGAVFSLFSYSSDPLALDVLDGKIFVCTDVYGLNHNLDPATYDVNKQWGEARFGYEGFIFNGNEVKSQKILTKRKEDKSSGIFYQSESYLYTRNGNVDIVLPQYIRWYFSNDNYTFNVINRKNLNLHILSRKNTSFVKRILGDPRAYCVLAKNKESYDRYMNNIQIKNQEKVDKDNLDRKRKQIEGMKDNQI